MEQGPFRQNAIAVGRNGQFGKIDEVDATRPDMGRVRYDGGSVSKDTASFVDECRVLRFDRV